MKQSGIYRLSGDDSAGQARAVRRTGRQLHPLPAPELPPVPLKARGRVR
ncbi:hypothetical protein [Streptomyces sp. NPDC002676]